MDICIQNEFLSVTINTLGAALSSIMDKEKTEYLWCADPLYWDEKAPILFPYIARLTNGRYTYAGETYHMAIHGFAKYKHFNVLSSTPDTLTLMLLSDTETKQQYPWNFVFQVTYRLIENKIMIHYEVHNLTDKTMYFAIGSHPGFSIPNEAGCSFEDYFLEFENDITPDRICFTADHFVTGELEKAYPLREGRYLDFKHSLFDQDALVLQHCGTSVALKNHRSKKTIRISYDAAMSYLGIWHTPKTTAPFVCIEPWSSLPSTKDQITDLAAQKDLLSLSAGAEFSTKWSIEIA